MLYLLYFIKYKAEVYEKYLLAITKPGFHQPRSQGLLRFQDGGCHLESGVDPGNEVGENLRRKRKSKQRR